MKVLKRGKSTLTLFIIAVALASCQKETSKPTATKKDVTAQARATPIDMNEGLGVEKRWPGLMEVSFADEYVENPQTGLFARVRITASCDFRIDPKTKEEKINSIKCWITSEGYYFRKAQVSTYINNTGTYGNIAYGIALSAIYHPNFADATFIQKDKTKNVYNDFLISASQFYGPVKPNSFKLKMDNCAFHLGTDRKLHFRWGT